MDLGQKEKDSMYFDMSSVSMDLIIVIVAVFSGFLVLLFAAVSCLCCYRRENTRSYSRSACRVSSRRDTVPLEELLAKPALADPESVFSELSLDGRIRASSCVLGSEGMSSTVFETSSSSVHGYEARVPVCASNPKGSIVDPTSKKTRDYNKFKSQSQKVGRSKQSVVQAGSANSDLSSRKCNSQNDLAVLKSKFKSNDLGQGNDYQEQISFTLNTSEEFISSTSNVPGFEPSDRAEVGVTQAGDSKSGSFKFEKLLESENEQAETTISPALPAVSSSHSHTSSISYSISADRTSAPDRVSISSDSHHLARSTERILGPGVAVRTTIERKNPNQGPVHQSASTTFRADFGSGGQTETGQGGGDPSKILMRRSFSYAQQGELGQGPSGGSSRRFKTFSLNLKIDFQFSEDGHIPESHERQNVVCTSLTESAREQNSPLAQFARKRFEHSHNKVLNNVNLWNKAGAAGDPKQHLLEELFAQKSATNDAAGVERRHGRFSVPEFVGSSIPEDVKDVHRRPSEVATLQQNAAPELCLSGGRCCSQNVKPPAVQSKSNVNSRNESSADGANGSEEVNTDKDKVGADDGKQYESNAMKKRKENNIPCGVTELQCIKSEDCNNDPSPDISKRSVTQDQEAVTEGTSGVTSNQSNEKNDVVLEKDEPISGVKSVQMNEPTKDDSQPDKSANPQKNSKDVGKTALSPGQKDLDSSDKKVQQKSIPEKTTLPPTPNEKEATGSKVQHSANIVNVENDATRQKEQVSHAVVQNSQEDATPNERTNDDQTSKLLPEAAYGDTHNERTVQERPKVDLSDRKQSAPEQGVPSTVPEQTQESTHGGNTELTSKPEKDIPNTVPVVQVKTEVAGSCSRPAQGDLDDTSVCKNPKSTSVQEQTKTYPQNVPGSEGVTYAQTAATENVPEAGDVDTAPGGPGVRQSNQQEVPQNLVTKAQHPPVTPTEESQKFTDQNVQTISNQEEAKNSPAPPLEKSQSAADQNLLKVSRQPDQHDSDARVVNQAQPSCQPEENTPNASSSKNEDNALKTQKDTHSVVKPTLKVVATATKEADKKDGSSPDSQTPSSQVKKETRKAQNLPPAPDPTGAKAGGTASERNNTARGIVSSQGISKDISSWQNTQKDVSSRQSSTGKDVSSRQSSSSKDVSTRRSTPPTPRSQKSSQLSTVTPQADEDSGPPALPPRQSRGSKDLYTVIPLQTRDFHITPEGDPCAPPVVPGKRHQNASTKPESRGRGVPTPSEIKSPDLRLRSQGPDISQAKTKSAFEPPCHGASRSTRENPNVPPVPQSHQDSYCQLRTNPKVSESIPSNSSPVKSVTALPSPTDDVHMLAPPLPPRRYRMDHVSSAPALPASSPPTPQRPQVAVKPTVPDQRQPVGAGSNQALMSPPTILKTKGCRRGIIMSDPESGLIGSSPFGENLKTKSDSQFSDTRDGHGKEQTPGLEQRPGDKVTFSLTLADEDCDNKDDQTKKIVDGSDESDYENPWDDLDDAVKRASMRYNRRPSRIAAGEESKELMLKSAEDLGRLMEEAEKRRQARQAAVRSTCQIDSPESPEGGSMSLVSIPFTRFSPHRHTVKGIMPQENPQSSEMISPKEAREKGTKSVSPILSRLKALHGGERQKGMESLRPKSFSNKVYSKDKLPSREAKIRKKPLKQ